MWHAPGSTCPLRGSAPGESLSEIALSCGMSDQAHFTRAFRRVVGETPNRWRQSRRAAALAWETPIPLVKAVYEPTSSNVAG